MNKKRLRHLGIAATLMLYAFMSYGQKVKHEIYPCKTDTIKGIMYRAIEYGSYSIETGYYISKCGAVQIGGISVIGQEDAPIWIPGKFLRRDEVDAKGKLVHKEFQEQYNTGYFTDEHFKKVQMSAVYGLLVERKERISCSDKMLINFYMKDSLVHYDISKGQLYLKGFVDPSWTWKGEKFKCDSMTFQIYKPLRITIDTTKLRAF